MKIYELLVKESHSFIDINIIILIYHRYNEQLEQLFLMGNPCADYQDYREYVIATLIQLKELDGTQIERSERIKALQHYAEIEGEIIRSCMKHKIKREAELLNYHEQIKSQKDQVSKYFLIL